MEKYDIAILGSGPGGYVAAIRAAQLGFKTACIEKDVTFGGTCLNVGCIPSKALLYSSEMYEKMLHEGDAHGVIIDNLRVDLDKMMARKQKVVKGLVDGVAFLLKKNKVSTYQGWGTLISPHTIAVGNEQIEATHIILASGSEPISLPFLPFDEKHIVSSTGALSLQKIPQKMVLVGAGVIGLELGSVYRRLGSEVEVIEVLDRPCPALDKEISSQILKIFKKQGITFHFSTKLIAGEMKGEKVFLKSENRDGKHIDHEADVVLLAIGRRPFIKNLGLDAVGVKLNGGGKIAVDGNFRTNVPSIYAIGDLIDGPMLAHKASEEGIAAVEIIAGRKAKIEYLAIPNVMYTWPEVACVGMTEEEARGADLEILVGKFPFLAVARARCSGDTDGMVKIIAEKNTDRVIGVHMIGPHASEMIGEGVIAIEERMRVTDLAYASHAHPTCAEAIKEAALACHGQMMHL
ncbi:MAG: dihydrolipoyl dehydrogenase [Chlamydiia bacterium]|nr:dihydrolipoyl dehydrogenase [Chlamydiia bacterium]